MPRPHRLRPALLAFAAGLGLALAAAPLVAHAGDHSVPVPDDLTSVIQTGGTPDLTIAVYDMNSTIMEVEWGDTLSFVAPAGFWTTGPDGEWTASEFSAAVAATGGTYPDYPGKFVDDLPVSLSPDGTTVTIQLPSEKPVGLHPITGDPLPENELGSWSPAGLNLDVRKTEPGTDTALDGVSILISVSFTEPAVDPTPEPVEPTIALSKTSVGAGGSVTASGSGFQPGETIEVWLHSTPQLLTTGTADGSGNFSATVTISSATTPGAHQIELRGTTTAPLFIDLTVLATLAATGAEIAVGGISAAALLLAGGVLLALHLSRRRRVPQHS